MIDLLETIQTNDAPQPIGAYSQAVISPPFVYISGQIPLAPQSSELVSDEIDAQIAQVFKNIQAIAVAAGGQLNRIVKLTIYLRDLEHFPRVNAIMASYFQTPYPARAVVEVSNLPKGALVEVDAVMFLKSTQI